MVLYKLLMLKIIHCKYLQLCHKLSNSLGSYQGLQVAAELCEVHLLLSQNEVERHSQLFCEIGFHLNVKSI